MCVKRVPAPGARIVLTDDAKAVDARHLAFTTSPHEECAVEEAVRLRELHGGEVVVLTVGPHEAEEQLRYAISVGADRGVLVPVTGGDPDPQATARAIAAAVRRLEAESVFDLILFGNESADAGGYQVGIRVGRALDRPVVNGVKTVAVADGAVTVRRETGVGFEVYRLPLPAAVGVKEGINLPRYPTLPGRLRSKKAEVAVVEVEIEPGGLDAIRLMNPPEQTSRTVFLGTGAAAAPRVVDLLEEVGVL